MGAAVQSVTLTEVTHRSVKQIIWDWKSTDLGAVVSTTSGYFTGRVLYAAQIPGLVAEQPSDAYDLTVTDANGVDVLVGLGANLTNAANTYKSDVDGLGCVVESKLTLTIAAAGDEKHGKTILYIR
jgi:hypothetical protein